MSAPPQCFSKYSVVYRAESIRDFGRFIVVGDFPDSATDSVRPGDLENIIYRSAAEMCRVT